MHSHHVLCQIHVYMYNQGMRNKDDAKLNKITSFLGHYSIYHVTPVN